MSEATPCLLAAAELVDQQISAVHSAFGAPGDYGYESREGKALHGLYLAQSQLRMAIRGTAERTQT